MWRLQGDRNRGLCSLWHKPQDDGVCRALHSPDWNDLVQRHPAVYREGPSLHLLQYPSTVLYQKRKEKEPTGQLPLPHGLQAFDWWTWQNKSVRKQEDIESGTNLTFVSCSVPILQTQTWFRLQKLTMGQFPCPLPMSNQSGLQDTVNRHPWTWLGFESA